MYHGILFSPDMQSSAGAVCPETLEPMLPGRRFSSGGGRGSEKIAGGRSAAEQNKAFVSRCRRQWIPKPGGVQRGFSTGYAQMAERR